MTAFCRKVFLIRAYEKSFYKTLSPLVTCHLSTSRVELVSPYAPMRPCLQPGCAELVKSGRCEKHQRQAYVQDRQQRGSAHQRGYTSRWARTSKRHLRLEPLCRQCLAANRITAATLTDHIVPVLNADDPLFYLESNFQSLCVDCHASKTKDDVRKGLMR